LVHLLVDEAVQVVPLDAHGFCNHCANLRLALLTRSATLQVPAAAHTQKKKEKNNYIQIEVLRVTRSKDLDQKKKDNNDILL
jgi:hypothetical protein